MVDYSIGECKEALRQQAPLTDLPYTKGLVGWLIGEVGRLKVLVEDAYLEGADDMRHGHEAYWSQSESKKELEDE